jgi:hypothetical protein
MVDKDIPTVLIAFFMKLRRHPLMTYRGLSSWPPVWTWIGGTDNRRPKGEIGTLKQARVSQIEPADRIFLYIEYEKASYIGCLLIDHPPFCRQIAQLLQVFCERPVREIGDLDLSHTL